MSLPIIPSIPAQPSVATGARHQYLDWLRVVAVGAVFLLHTGHLFDPVDWHVKNARHSDVIAFGIAFVNFWVIPLLFVVSGASSFLALHSGRGPMRYAIGRCSRLLVPYVFGMVLISPWQAYLDAVYHGRFRGSFSGFLPTLINSIGPDPGTPGLITYPSLHLWFLWHLLLVSLLVVPALPILDKRIPALVRGWFLAMISAPGGVVFLAVPIAAVRLCSQPGMPSATGWSEMPVWALLCSYGYALAGSGSLRRAFMDQRRILIAVGLVTFFSIIPLYYAGILPRWFDHPEYSATGVFMQVFWTLTSWSWTAGIFGLAAANLDRPSRMIGYCNEACLPFYVLHHPVLLSVAFIVVQWPLGVWGKFAVIGGLAFLLTAALYEGPVRRIGPLRVLLGMRRVTPARAGDPTDAPAVTVVAAAIARRLP